MRRLYAWIEDRVIALAEFLGTVKFLGLALLTIAAWVIINGGYGFFSHAFVDVATGKPFDPAPWILLNLIFSFEAFFSASLIIIAQKAQSKRDHARQEDNAVHREALAQATHEHILRLEEALLDHMLRVEAILVSMAAQEPRRDEEGEDPSSPSS